MSAKRLKPELKKIIKKESSHVSGLKWKLINLLRTRVLLSVLGLICIKASPDNGQWIAMIVVSGMGVSAVEAWKGARDGTEPSN